MINNHASQIEMHGCSYNFDGHIWKQTDVTPGWFNAPTLKQMSGLILLRPTHAKLKENLQLPFLCEGKMV